MPFGCSKAVRVIAEECGGMQGIAGVLQGNAEGMHGNARDCQRQICFRILHKRKLKAISLAKSLGKWCFFFARGTVLSIMAIRKAISIEILRFPLTFAWDSEGFLTISGGVLMMSLGK